MSITSAAAWLHPFDARWLAAARHMPIEAFRNALTSESQHRGLVTGHGKPLSFVPQEALPADSAYESWIAQTGCVPTRDNLHDRFNALVWISAPQTKARLNALQSHAIDVQLSHQHRGRLRDAATIWDENLAVITASAHADQLIEALHAHDWPMLFDRMRGCWSQEWQVFIFGHALLEKLEAPFKSITAHVVVIPVSVGDMAWPDVDIHLTASLHDAWTPSMFHHLPVLGIPGWNAANEDPMFYCDDQVFRPLRR